MARPTARYAVTAEDKTKAGLNSVKKSLGGLRGSFAAIAAISGAVFGAFAKSAISSADELNKLNTQLGFSTEALSQYKFVAQQTGVEFTALTTGLQRMVRRVGEAAQGTGEAKNALFELGVDAKRLAQLRPEQQFEVLADAFARVSNQGDKVRLAFKLFDTEGVRLLRTMEGGSEAVRALRAEFDQMGGTLTQDVANTATEATDAMGRLRAQFSATSVELIRIFGPAITEAAKWLGENIPKAALQAERFLVRARQGFTTIAAGIADLFGKKDVAKDLRDLASVYATEFDQLTAQFGKFKAEIGEAVNANDFFDDSLKKLAGTTVKQTGVQKELNKELAKARAITEGVRTPLEDYSASVAELQGFLDREQISQQTFTRGIAAAREELQQGLGIDPTPLQEYTSELGRLDEALAATAISFDEYARGRFQLEEGLDAGLDPEKIKEKTTETQKALEEFGKGTAQSLRTTFSDLFFDGFNSDLDDLASNFANAMRRVAADFLANAALQAIAGSSLGTTAFGGLFGKALGGPVAVNGASIVGEHGPELLTNAPPGSQVIPGGGASLTVNVAADAGITRESAGQVGYTLGRTIQDWMRRNA